MELAVYDPDRQAVLICFGSETFGLSLSLTQVKVGNQIARTTKGWFKSTATDSRWMIADRNLNPTEVRYVVKDTPTGYGFGSRVLVGSGEEGTGVTQHSHHSRNASFTSPSHDLPGG
jgi:hypothetical protein